jgi:hypothetical protein
MQPTERIIIADHSSKKWLYALGGFIAGVAGTVAAAFFIADSDKGGSSCRTTDTDEPEEGSAEPTCAEGEEGTRKTAEDDVKAMAETPETASA